MRVIGFDPGSWAAGFGVIDAIDGRYQYVASGTIRLKGTLEQRLLALYRSAKELIERYEPNQAAVERVFVKVNPLSALKLGHARGVLLLAIAEAGLEAAEYSPRLVKKAATGYGAASKAQMQMMITELLHLNAQPKEDAADALSIALCHLHHGTGVWVQHGS